MPLPTRLLRRLLVVALFVGVGVIGLQEPASACSCVRQTLQQQVKRADAVFTGSVTTSAAETVGTGKRATQVRRSTTEVDRVFKGVVSSSPVMVTSPEGAPACGFGTIPADEPWVFVVRGHSQRFVGNSCGGSGPATTAYLAEVTDLLGEGTPLAEPVPEQPPLEYTSLQDKNPAGLGQLLAPGAAIALLGLLGLLLVRRLAHGPE